MIVINVRNVCEALPQGVRHLRVFGRKESSRAGEVIVAPTPVTTVYSNPTERVLFHPKRDANPFFHLFESLAMLAGDNTASYLNQFIKDFGYRFAESDGTIHDSYGYRWRKAFGFDQLDEIVRILKNDPGSRQCVLQMWDCSDQDDLLGKWKTRPCNTHVYFRIRNEVSVDGLVGSFTSKNGLWPLLDMTVCCRSNDMLFGAYGANAVHFSILQEYLAARLGVLVGSYYQVSNNFHIYSDLWEKARACNVADNRYQEHDIIPIRLVDDPETFDQELAWFMNGEWSRVRNNKFLTFTAMPMYRAITSYRHGYGHEMSHADEIEAVDWRVACTEWLQQRISRVKGENSEQTRSK